MCPTREREREREREIQAMHTKMLLKESLTKPNKLFNKGFQNLKKFVHGGYKKFSKPPTCNPFSCSRRFNHKDHEFDQYDADSLEEMESDHDEVIEKKVVLVKEQPVKEGNEGPAKVKDEERRIMEERKIGLQREKSYLKSEIGGSYRLAQKMKEMEMMDVGDVDHVLDVEEVLHYYSRLKSPVYLEIVDKFFIDINSDIVPLKPIVSKNNSKRRVRQLKLRK